MKRKSYFLSLVTGILLLSTATLFAQSGPVVTGVQVVSPSSERYKEDIHDMDEASTSLMRLRPVTFHYKEEYDAGDGELQYGLIAEEVADEFPDLVVYNEDGTPETVKYHLLVTLLLNELQKQYQVNQEQAAAVARLEQQDRDLEGQVAELAALAAEAQELAVLKAQTAMQYRVARAAALEASGTIPVPAEDSGRDRPAKLFRIQVR